MLGVMKHPLKKVELMAMGSSIGFYALDSRELVDSVDSAYYNFSTWNLQISDMKNLLSAFVKDYQPKYVLLCSSFGDFTKPMDETYLNYVNTPGYIRQHVPEFFYLKNYRSIHQMAYREHIAKPIAMDKWGTGVLAPDHQQNVDVPLQFPSRYTSDNYNALDTLAAWLRDEHVKFIFVQSPARSYYLSEPVRKTHFEKCRSIVENDGGIYLNYYNPAIFNDTLFFDKIHFRTSGAKLLTKEMIPALHSIIK
jgi:hypothetical protein